MRIARLELHGFKSFADRTVFHFGSGISCVVGPNGCGKSNVVDALKWVIGEMSAKTLRGDDMLDVIFAGSADRKPVGYAEVSLTFTAEGTEPFPGEYARFSEVQVTRRLYRDSTSEYLLNQTRCRRKDIVDLIMDSGVGNHLYSFIEQGRIDKIVSASPEDRRSLVDEAAGITRYKLRRQEAQQKLEATCSQLDRAADVTDEMGKRLATLEKAVVKAARFRRARAIVRQHEIALALARLAELRAERIRISARFDEVTHLADAAETRASALEEDLVLRERELEVAAAAVATAREAVVEVDAERRAADAVLSLHARRADEVGGQITSAQQEIDLAFSRGERAQADAERASERLVEIEASLLASVATAEEGAQLAQAADAELAIARETAAHAELGAERATSELREARTRREGLAQRDRELGAAVERAQGRASATVDEGIVTSKRIEVAQGAISVEKQEIELLEAERQTVAYDLDEIVRREVHARDAVARAEIELDEAQKAWTAAVQRVDAESGRIEEQVSQQVAAQLRKEDEGFGQRARDATRRLAEAEDGARRAMSERTAQGAARVEAARQEAEAAVEAWRQEAFAGFDGQDTARQAEADEAARAGADEVAQVEATWRAEHEAELATARERRETADQAVEVARTALRDAEARLARAERALREVDGQLAAVEAELKAGASREAGAAAVSAALPGVKRLVDRLSADELARPEVTAALGDRLLLPSVSTAEEIERASGPARKAGAARLLLAPEGPAALMGRVNLVDTLAEAVGGHLREGGTWRVRSSGEGVDAGGVVSLGDVNRVAGQQVALQRRLAELTAARAEAAEAADTMRAELTSSRARVESAGVTARRAAELADAAEKKGREAGRALVQAAQQRTGDRVKALRAAHQSWRAGARGALDAELGRRRGEVAGRVAAVKAEADAAIATARQEAEARLMALRAEVEAQNESLRLERARRADELRAAALDRAREGLAVHQAERDKHRAEVDRRSRALSSARERAGEAGKVVASARAGVDRVSQRVSERRQVLIRLEAELNAAKEQKLGLERRAQALTAELAQSREELAALREKLGEQEAVMAGLESRAADRSSALAVARERRSVAERAASELRRAASAAEAQVASLREERAQLVATAEGGRRAARDAAERLEAAQLRLGGLARQHDEVKREVAEAEAKITVLAARRQEAVVVLDAASARDLAARQARDAVAGELAERSGARDRYRREQLELEDVHRRLGQERATIADRMDERYQVEVEPLLDELIEASGITLRAPDEVRTFFEIGGRKFEAVDDLIVRPEMLSDPETVKALVARVEESRNELSRIGEVNLTAFEEYTELKVRYDEIETQRADLDESVSSIRQAIAKLNKTCRERFREAFDRVNEAFRTAYPELVGGGEAQLSLTNEEDLLETGVEIMVRPPGKRMQTLSLLSGGEKAMTAIALLLALFSVKPSPFCVLDEVDAPLDEANGARFNDMIKRMAAMTQFIVITHNRKTMECADTLYGVTMPTPGASALVSVKIDG